MQPHFAIGIMSGTSLDGLDLAYCSFTRHESGWKYELHQANTLPYPSLWEERLRQAPALPGDQLVKLHYDYGIYIGQKVNEFIQHHRITQAGIIASHGHTLFHRPGMGYTFQAGSGAAIAACTGLPVVCDFRSLDVALNGQGAPLVPIGDHHLFADYQYCLNLGGFANISFVENKIRTAFDICPVNFVINRLIREANLPAVEYSSDLPAGHSLEGFLQFDPAGAIAANGNIDAGLLEQLNRLDFYHVRGPKSLGEEWVMEHFMPLIRTHELPLKDLLRTLYEHIALQIALCTRKVPGQQMLITGGGAYNSFLTGQIAKQLQPYTQTIIPPARIIEFKEALVFAFLGILRMHHLPNSLSAVTGSLYDNIGGCIYLGTRG